MSYHSVVNRTFSVGFIRLIARIAWAALAVT